MLFKCAKAVFDQRGSLLLGVDGVELGLDRVHSESKQSLLECFGNEEEAADGFQLFVFNSTLREFPPFLEHVQLRLGVVQAQQLGNLVVVRALLATFYEPL